MTTQQRSMAVAGTFYPAQAEQLHEMITGFLAATPGDPLDAVRAVVAPHAGYVYSGPIAASAYRALSPTAPPTRFYVLGPSHRTWFEGVAVGDYATLETPLGALTVDTESVQQLLQTDRCFVSLEHAHRAEHCLEVQFPFLCYLFPQTPVVPLLFGEVNPNEIARHLLPLLHSTDVLVVSSDLSHYHSYGEARTRDQTLLAALQAGDRLAAAQGEACGLAPLLTLMVIAAARGWQPHLLDYRTSGDTAGDKRQVVGYAAVAYTEVGA